MSRRALATEAGVAPYTVRRVEEGKPTQTDTLEALAKALGLRLSLTTTQEKTCTKQR